MTNAAKLSTIERHQRRIWGLCYRMTGDRAAADDLAQESAARAIAKADDASDEAFEGWLYRVATTTCLDWLRRKKTEANAVTLVDPIDLEDAPFSVEPTAELRLLRRDDIRLALLTSLRCLPPRQRAVLVLRDVLDRTTEETAETLGVSAGNVKVMLHRARARLDEAHRIGMPDAPVDAAIVERFARALETADLEALTSLLSEDVWGLVDDGSGRRRPTVGRRAVARQWRNAFDRFQRAEAVLRTRANGEPSVTIILGGSALASIHLETRSGRVAAIRVILDPPRLARLT